MNAINPLFDPSTDNQPIAEDTQKMLNTPLPGGHITGEDRDFLEMIKKKVEEKTIRLYEPSSLLNQSVYDSLPLEGKAKADTNAVAMLAKIRDIINLEKANFDTNVQVLNLVNSLRLNKENMETMSGDIFII